MNAHTRRPTHTGSTPSPTERCAEIGRDPGEIELSAGVNGDPEVNGSALLEQGVTTFTLEVHGPDFDLSAVRAWVAWRDKLGD